MSTTTKTTDAERVKELEADLARVKDQLANDGRSRDADDAIQEGQPLSEAAWDEFHRYARGKLGGLREEERAGLASGEPYPALEGPVTAYFTEAARRHARKLKDMRKGYEGDGMPHVTRADFANCDAARAARDELNGRGWYARVYDDSDYAPIPGMPYLLLASKYHTDPDDWAGYEESTEVVERHGGNVDGGESGLDDWLSGEPGRTDGPID